MSALVIVDMHNNFVHADNGFAHLAHEHPEAKIDTAFLMRIIPYVCKSSRFPVRVLWPSIGTSLSPGWIPSLERAGRLRCQLQPCNRVATRRGQRQSDAIRLRS